MNTMLNCQVCQKEFEQPHREQGGGGDRAYRLRKKERKAEWANSRSPMTEERRAYNRKLRLKKYGISEQELENLLIRQNNRCQICKEPFEGGDYKIDHCHKTNKVRGLLCVTCNLGVGQFKDSKILLTNVVAYLDRDIKKRYIYLIGSLANGNIPHIGNKLRSKGYIVYDHWWGAGKDADKSWHEYSKIKGLSFKEALKDVGAETVFHFDRSRIEMSDICILVMPAGKSGHLELGYASGLEKKTYILYEGEPDRYDVMPQFANQGVYYKLEELINELSSDISDRGNRDLLQHGLIVPTVE